MASTGGYTHEKELEQYLEEFKKAGWKTINLKGFTPDGIVVKNNFVAAVEIITLDNDESPHSRDMDKRYTYRMFDKVFIKKVYRDKEFDEYAKKRGKEIW